MVLKMKKDSTGRFCIVEKFDWYWYNGVVNVTHVFNICSAPMIFKGGLFKGLSEIPDGVGVRGYLKAKKPFYSVVDRTSCLVEVKVKLYEDGRDPEFRVYILKPLGVVADGLAVQRVSCISGLPLWVLDLIAESGSDREKFLLGRKRGFEDVSSKISEG